MNRPHAPLRSARAFTMLEVMLAGSLGMIVIFAAMAFFTTIERAKKFQAERLESNTEHTTAHKVIQQAMRSLLMADAAGGRDEDQKQRIEDDIKDATDHPDERNEEASLMRFSLQPESGARTPDGRPVQTLEVTLTTPPIHAVTLLSGAEQAEAQDLRQMMRMRQHTLDLWDSSRAASATAAGAKGPTGKGSDEFSSKNAERDPNRTAARADRLRSASVGLAGAEASSDAIASAADRDTEAPRAPGLRGMFEVRPDDVRPGTPSDEQGLSLWWKQLPPEDDLLPTQENGSGGIADPKLLELARRSRADAPQMKLLSGLKNARWRVYRRRAFVDKMAAKTAKELPAYVEFSFETVKGRRVDWLFEVAWSYGAEPGTILAVNDPLGAPLDSTDVAAQINDAVNRAINGQKPGQTPGTGPGTGQVAGTTGGRTNTGTGTGPSRGQTPGNTSQADIDAILRQFGFGGR